MYVFQRLSNPAVERFGLQREALEAACGGELFVDELDDLLDDLGAVAEGQRQASELLSDCQAEG